MVRSLSGRLRRAVLAPVVAGVVATLAPIAGGNASQPPASQSTTNQPGVNRFELGYEVYMGGLNGMAFTTQIDLNPDRYRMTITGATKGMLDWLLEWRMNVVSEGAADAKGIMPQRHESANRIRGKDRSVNMRFASGGVIDWSVEPVNQDDDRDPVLPDQVIGAVDPMSGLLSAVLRLAAGDTCDQTVPIFDGRRRFDGIGADKGPIQVTKTAYGLYEGAARACEFRIKRIAGYLKRETQWNRPEDLDRPYRIFIARPQPGLPPVPVRIESDMTFGSIVIHLVSARQISDTAAR